MNDEFTKALTDSEADALLEGLKSKNSGGNWESYINTLSPKERREYAGFYAYMTEVNRAADEKFFKFYQLGEYREFEENLDRIKREATAYFSDRIEALTYKLSGENGIDLLKAYEILSGSERDAYMLTIKEYTELAKEGALNLTPEQRRLLNTTGIKARVNRLEALCTELDLYTARMGKALRGEFGKIITAMAAGRYKTGAFNIFKYYGLGVSLSKFSTRRLTAALIDPWAPDGKNLSDRFNNRQDKIRYYIKKQLMAQVVTGESYTKIINGVAAMFDSEVQYVARLLTTEAAFIASCADRMMYEDLGVKQFQFVATLDEKTSPFCRAMDGMRFPLSEYEPGLNAPPLHGYCRSTTIPLTTSWEGLPTYIPAKRAMRGKDGKTYLIPATMNYREWENLPPDILGEIAERPTAPATF